MDDSGGKKASHQILLFFLVLLVFTNNAILTSCHCPLPPQPLPPTCFQDDEGVNSLLGYFISVVCRFLESHRYSSAGFPSSSESFFEPVSHVCPFAHTVDLLFTLFYKFQLFSSDLLKFCGSFSWVSKFFSRCILECCDVLSRFSRVRLFCKPHGPWPARLLCTWDSPGKNTGVGCHAFLQGTFLTQRSNPCLLHLLFGSRVLYHWHHLGRPFWNTFWHLFAVWVWDYIKSVNNIR